MFYAAFKNWWNYNSALPDRRHGLHRATVLISTVNQTTDGFPLRESGMQLILFHRPVLGLMQRM